MEHKCHKIFSLKHYKVFKYLAQKTMHGYYDNSIRKGREWEKTSNWLLFKRMKFQQLIIFSSWHPRDNIVLLYINIVNIYWCYKKYAIIHSWFITWEVNFVFMKNKKNISFTFKCYKEMYKQCNKLSSTSIYVLSKNVSIFVQV